MAAGIRIPFACLTATLVLGSSAVGMAACGSEQATSSRRASSTVAAVGAEAAGASNLPYLNDGDAEKKNDGDQDNRNGNHEDSDADSVEEYEDTYDNNRYRDSDDGVVVTLGHALGAADEKAIAQTVKRYYAAAAADDGASACSLLATPLANALPEDYGHESVGPSYLRAGRTCQAVLSLLFKHFHRSLQSAIAVTGVRALGAGTQALVGSRTMPASVIAVTREGGAWKVDNMLGAPLR